MIITLTASPTPPRVEIVATGMPATTTTVTVTRSTDTDTWPVRGGAEALAGTGLMVVDWETPTGVPVTYQITARDSTGATVDTATATATTIPDAGPGWMWLSDPLDETSPILVHTHTGTDAHRAGGRDTTSAHPLGSRWPVPSIGPRTRLQDWHLVLLLDDTTAGPVRALSDRALIVCVRPAAALRLEPLLYVAVTGSDEEPWHEQLGLGTPRWRSLLTLTCTATRGTELSPSVYAWTWDDVNALNLTWDQLWARWPTWNDVQRGDA